MKFTACHSLFENSQQNFIIPIEHINTLLLTCEMELDDDKVIATVPLLV